MEDILQLIICCAAWMYIVLFLEVYFRSKK